MSYPDLVIDSYILGRKKYMFSFSLNFNRYIRKSYQNFNKYCQLIKILILSKFGKFYFDYNLNNSFVSLSRLRLASRCWFIRRNSPSADARCGGLPAGWLPFRPIFSHGARNKQIQAKGVLAEANTQGKNQAMQCLCGVVTKLVYIYGLRSFDKSLTCGSITKRAHMSVTQSHVT